MPETPAQGSAAEPTRRMGWGLSGLLVTVALLALGSVYAATTLGDRDRAPRPAASAAAHDPHVTYHGFYGEERGPFGLTWRWLSDAGAIEVKGSGLKWLAFRATSYKRPRRLYVQTRAGTQLRVPIDQRTRMHIAGPLQLDGDTIVSLVADPPPERAPDGDNRKLSVFLSGTSLVAEPAAAMPAAGFARTELDERRRPFNWMGTRGRLDVLVLPRVTKRAWVTFKASSVDGAVRTVTISANGTSHRVRVPPRGRREQLTAGPFPLENGAARLTLTTDPPGRTYFPDKRRLSMQVWDLAASSKAPTR